MNPGAAVQSSAHGISRAPGADDLDRIFPRVSDLMRRLSGVSLKEQKKSLVRARLARRLRELGLGSFRAYLDYVEGPGGRDELVTMVDLLTTNKTNFFREVAHFDFLRGEVLRDPGSRLRLWSAGCSSGEEPYTLAMVLRDSLRDRVDARILGTDISTRILEKARRGTYTESELEGVPPDYRRRYFDVTSSGGAAAWRVKPEVRRLVALARLNLLEPWPMRGPFDVILCRNVMIYFDTDTRQTLVRRFAELLAPGGYLFVGHSESLNALDHGLHYVRPAIYRR